MIFFTKFLCNILSEKTRKKNTKDIWDDDEVIEGSEFDAVYDPRPQPE